MINKKAELPQRWPRDASLFRCPEDFRECLSTPTATFPDIFNGFVPIDHVNVRRKFELCSVTRSRGNRDTLKLWLLPGYAQAPFSPKVLAFVRIWNLRMYWHNLKAVAIPVP